MIELIIKMTFWLLASMGLGLFVGWLFFRNSSRKKYIEELDSLDAIISERNRMLDVIEKKFRNEKIRSQKSSEEIYELEKMLSEKTSMVTQLKTELDSVDRVEDEHLKQRVKELERLDRRREKELEEFESVLLKAEESIEKQAKEHLKIVDELTQKIDLLELENHEKVKTIELYQDRIAELEEELKLYTANSKDAEFVISKDQFTKIEEQLEKYQEEIRVLKKEKSDLLNNLKEDEDDSLKEEILELNDGSIGKLFRETYKRITKS